MEVVQRVVPAPGGSSVSIDLRARAARGALAIAYGPVIQLMLYRWRVQRRGNGQW